ncbi:hypothetical protein D9615_000757 [Tricholomella constricta]|uniref:Uncharacterized protein n=1 Tax=Tricholomella constricta TaxID=117010 RepID=A0A8H5HQN8_9AGAR|nr:hypothetical protein D9615_000757 [Tricholomella constricta]
MVKDDEKEKKEQEREARGKRVPRNMAHINKDPSTCSLLIWGSNWFPNAMESTGSSLGDQPENNFPIYPYVLFANEGSTSSAASSSLKNAAAATPPDQGTHSPSGYVQGPGFSSRAALNRDSPDHGANLLRDEVGLPQSHFSALGNHLIVDSSTSRPSSSYVNHLPPMNHGGISTTASSPRVLATPSSPFHPHAFSPDTNVHIDNQAPSLFTATSYHPGVSPHYPSSSFQQRLHQGSTEGPGAYNFPSSWEGHTSDLSPASAGPSLANSTAIAEQFPLATGRTTLFGPEFHSPLLNQVTSVVTSLPGVSSHYPSPSQFEQNFIESPDAYDSLGYYLREGYPSNSSPASAGPSLATSTALLEQSILPITQIASLGSESHTPLPNHNLQITSYQSHSHISIMDEALVMGGGSDGTWVYSSLPSSGSAQTTQPDQPSNLYDEQPDSLHDRYRSADERSAPRQYLMPLPTSARSFTLVDRRHSEWTPRQNNHPYREPERRAHRTVGVNPRIQENPSFGPYMHTPPATDISASVLMRGENHTHEAPQRPQKRSRSFEEQITSSSSPSIPTTSSQFAPQKTLASGSNTHRTRIRPRNSIVQPYNLRSRSGVAATHPNRGNFSPGSQIPEPSMPPLTIPDQRSQYLYHGMGLAAAGPSRIYDDDSSRTPRAYSSSSQPVLLQDYTTSSPLRRGHHGVNLTNSTNASYPSNSRGGFPDSSHGISG